MENKLYITKECSGTKVEKMCVFQVFFNNLLEFYTKYDNC